MTSEQARAEIHEQFDAICAQVGDWEPLPNVASANTDLDYEYEDEQAKPLNDLILAGLVAPY